MLPFQKVQIAKSRGLLLSKGRVENQSTSKQEMVNGNLNRQVIEEEAYIGNEDTTIMQPFIFLSFAFACVCVYYILLYLYRQTAFFLFVSHLLFQQNCIKILTVKLSTKWNIQNSKIFYDVSTCGKGTAYAPGASEFNPCFSGVRDARSLAFCVMFYRSLFILLSFSFGHCVVCPSSIYDF